MTLQGCPSAAVTRSLAVTIGRPFPWAGVLGAGDQEWGDGMWRIVLLSRHLNWQQAYISGVRFPCQCLTVGGVLVSGEDLVSELVLIEAARGRWAELVRAAETGRATRLRDRDSGAEAILLPLGREGISMSGEWPVWAVTDARPKLGDLVRQAAGGQSVVLARRGRPVAGLVASVPLGGKADSPAGKRSLTRSEFTTEVMVAAPVGDLLDSLTTETRDAPVVAPVPTGLPGLDDVTAGGLRPGRLAVLTASSGAGSTALALGMVRAAALGERSRPVLVVPGRLTARDVLLRVLAAEADADLQHIATNSLPDADRQRVSEVAARLRTAPLHLADHLSTLDQVRAAAERIDGLALVVLDPVTHLDLTAPVPPPLALRRLARELPAAVLAVATSGAPGIEDLAVEADLDLYLDRDDEQASLTLRRHRHGPTAAWALRADLARARLLPRPTDDPLPPSPSPPAAVSEAPEDVPAPVAVVVPVGEPDRLPDGTVVTAAIESCVLCGQPTPYRAAGRPQHIGGFCTNTAPAPGTAGTAGTAGAAPAGTGPEPTTTATGPVGAATPTTAAAAGPAGTAPAGPGQGSGPGPGRPQRRQEETGGLIAQAVAAALEDNGGDMDAALTTLVKRAIPDGMALLNSTRVGSTYDFTHYLSVDDIPILKKPSRDGADQIWEGRPKWRNHTAETGPARTVTALDVNGAYLSALKTHLPIGTLRHNPDGTYDRKRSGVYLITPPEWAHEDLPNPLGNRDEPGPLWVTDPTLRLLNRLAGPKHGLCAAPVIHESWTSGSSEALLERFRRELATARDTAIETDDRVTLEYIKAMYSKFVSTIGESSANREMRRPDWMHIIRSQAFTNLWLKAWKAHQAGLTIVRMTGTDELHVTGGDWRTVFTEGRRLTDMKLKTEYTIGRGEG
ncbi:type II toxin-antitoxin system prevent-host-death family antitoxin [Streptomyces sp. DSM 44915]|uniref:Type II toxin-antitoxin system prevent-host-death family antitoxin n=1 Tax=Streptomyces chisholmiae TaxID=3075540 RepID=A0ABU2JRD4_9ACTN|nr:type II toxin-antitoxin system prevent-host-death family antitoxin [Streptomyces sp. DSM 44915]MDT0267542.1 type II toxin-antitoxin system prevent-host-death family antitoxin [Streptomyces sp. DSM 44915]